MQIDEMTDSWPDAETEKMADSRTDVQRDELHTHEQTCRGMIRRTKKWAGVLTARRTNR